MELALSSAQALLFAHFLLNHVINIEERDFFMPFILFFLENHLYRYLQNFLKPLRILLIIIAELGLLFSIYQATTAESRYYVTLDGQNPSRQGTSKIIVTYGSDMPGISVPLKKGYEFGGYYDALNGTGTQYYNADGDSVHIWDKPDDGTLYAKWT